MPLKVANQTQLFLLFQVIKNVCLPQ